MQPLERGARVLAVRQLVRVDEQRELAVSAPEIALAAIVGDVDAREREQHVAIRGIEHLLGEPCITTRRRMGANPLFVHLHDVRVHVLPVISAVYKRTIPTIDLHRTLGFKIALVKIRVLFKMLVGMILHAHARHTGAGVNSAAKPRTARFSPTRARARRTGAEGEREERTRARAISPSHTHVPALGSVCVGEAGGRGVPLRRM